MSAIKDEEVFYQNLKISRELMYIYYMYYPATSSAVTDPLLKQTASEQLYYMTTELAIFRCLEIRFLVVPVI